MNTRRSLALFATLIITIAPCRADKDVAVSQLPRRVLKAVEARYPSGHILKAEWESEGYYEIKVAAFQVSPSLAGSVDTIRDTRACV